MLSADNAWYAQQPLACREEQSMVGFATYRGSFLYQDNTTTLLQSGTYRERHGFRGFP